MAMTRDALQAKASELLGRVARAGRMGDHDRASDYERELRGVWASLARMGSATGQGTAERPTVGTDGATGTADAPEQADAKAAVLAYDPTARPYHDHTGTDPAGRSVILTDGDVLGAGPTAAAAWRDAASELAGLADARPPATGHADEDQWLAMLADIRRADADEPDPATETELLDLFVALDEPDAWAGSPHDADPA